MNVSDRKNIAFARTEDMKKHISLLLESSQQIFTEYDIDLLELTKAKRSISDKIPVHVALFILQLSKLHMLKFLDFLYEHLIHGSFRLLYMDTDSYTFSLADEIDNLVRPEKKDSYDSRKFDWFLRDDSAKEQRWPGKVRLISNFFLTTSQVINFY